MSEEAQAVVAVVMFFGTAVLLTRILTLAQAAKAGVAVTAILAAALLLVALGVDVAGYIALGAVVGCCLLGYTLAFKRV